MDDTDVLVDVKSRSTEQETFVDAVDGRLLGLFDVGRGRRRGRRGVVSEMTQRRIRYSPRLTFRWGVS